MWKKSDDEPQPTYRPEPRPADPPPRSTGGSTGRAVIGSSIRVKGDLSGEEDLVVEGRIDGKIDLRQHTVTVGKGGRVKADIYARTIYVEGEVEGNLYSDEQVTVRQSGNVQGNITAPRVSLEDGAKFKGAIDMEPKSGRAPGGKPNTPEPRRAETVTPAGPTTPAAGATSATAGKGPG